MKREMSPLYLALMLALGCIAFRLLGNLYPSLLPNVSPLMALAFVGAMYLPRAWGWLLGPATLIVTDLAFLSVNRATEGAMFSWFTLVSLAVYALAGGFGIALAKRKSLARILSGSVLCSLAFYLAANTFSWWIYLVPQASPGYPATLGGWWMANTTGLPGWVPTWTFLRNGVIGDLAFALVLLLILDRGLLFGARRAPTTAARA